jgi:hypothetical protein
MRDPSGKMTNTFAPIEASRKQNLAVYKGSPHNDPKGDNVPGGLGEKLAQDHKHVSAVATSAW